MTGALQTRLAKLEARRGPMVQSLPKADRDRAVAAILCDPEKVIEIRTRLLGSHEYAQRNVAAIMAALRADT